MDGFDLLLSKQPYMAGSVSLPSSTLLNLHPVSHLTHLLPSMFACIQQLTLPDLFFLPYGQGITQLGYDYLTNETKWPNVARWWKDVSSREACIAVKDGIPTTGIPA
ncbi:hypothetical protein FRC18_011043 [Serendipita sp. 400]|nr:hypothetical protein FRC18_011043 [Serendipita sp. 400]